MYFCHWLNCTRNVYGSISLRPFYKTTTKKLWRIFICMIIIKQILLYINSVHHFTKMFIVDFVQCQWACDFIMCLFPFWEDYDVNFPSFCRKIGAIIIKVLMSWIFILGDYLIMFKLNISYTNIWRATFYN